ncbi:MAG: PAS domain S-box protein [Sneathiellales bacterium]|nr:PAS domain S-box protein [Sneathiellales bacterium]
MHKLSDLDTVLIDALEHASEAFAIYDAELNLVHCNSNFRKLYSYTVEQTRPGTPVLDLLKLDIENGNLPVGFDACNPEKYIKRRRDFSRLRGETFEIQLQNGQWLSINEGNTASGGLVSIQRDITDSKRTEEEFRKAADLFRTAFNADDSARSITVLETGQFIDVNRAWCALRGIERKDVIGKTAYELNVWGGTENRNLLIDVIREQKQGGVLETRITRKNKEKRNVILSWQVVFFEGEECLFLSSRDVTDLRRVEAAQRESDRLLRVMFENAPIGLALYESEKYSLVLANQRYREITGIEDENASGLDWRNLTHPDDLERELVQHQRFLKGETDEYQLEKRYVHPDGTVRLAQVSLVSVQKVTPDDALRHLAMLTDITDRKETELALQVSQERFSDFTRVGTEWYWEMDQEMNYTYLSSAVEKSLGLPESDYIGLSYLDFKGENEDLQEAEKIMIQKCKAHESFSELVIYRRHNQTNNKVWLRVNGYPFFDEMGAFAGYRGSSSDITEQVELEERLQQAQKMEVVGQLSGGIAHDFNNLLGVIQGNAELAKEKIELGVDDSLQHLSAILRAADRGAELTQSMLAFSRKQALNPTSIRLDEQIRQMEQMIRSAIGEQVLLSTSFEKELWHCEVDPGKVENVVLNLCINAKDAMYDGGELILRLKNSTLKEEDLVNLPDIEPGRYVALEVEDSGVGMPEDIIDHVFEPFFTTKEIGKGTGLGLSMVYGFARQSRGFVDIQSEEEKGTLVTVYLPCAKR